jgi:predicted GTPase
MAAVAPDDGPGAPPAGAEAGCEPCERILVLGAAGRDFHSFSVLFRGNPHFRVVGFTAAQIPRIGGRRYPPALAGALYPDGLPIFEEAELERVVREERVDRCLLAYSDLSYEAAMAVAARCLAAGADFSLAAPARTALAARKPVVAVCATRTGCGKSAVSRYVVARLRARGVSSTIVRHPMPYGDLEAQRLQRFARYEDLERHGVTIEEREEYEQHLDAGTVVFAGVDYAAILAAAEAEASDVIVWDGGNNDSSFFKPDLLLCVADPHRARDCLTYYPGAINFMTADAVVVSKANTAPAADTAAVVAAARAANPAARVYVVDSAISLDEPALVRGRRVVSVDDGPSLTHGGRPVGAGFYAARDGGAAEVLDPRPAFVGSLKAALEKWPHLGATVPALGYYDEQVQDLEATLAALPRDATVVVATPMDLRRLIKIAQPTTRARYAVADRPGEPALAEEIDRFVDGVVLKRRAAGGAASSER